MKTVPKIEIQMKLFASLSEMAANQQVIKLNLKTVVQRKGSVHLKNSEVMEL